jgi:hypothetical protein
VAEGIVGYAEMILLREIHKGQEAADDFGTLP